VIGQIVPDSPADRAGLSSGMKVIGINGRIYSFERLETAIQNAAESKPLVLLVQYGDELRDVTIDYTGGLRYLVLEPIPEATLWFDKIIQPAARE
jgi:predicted metalloprotease with PDZ domain